MIAVVDRDTWPTPPLFRFIREHGKISEEELFRVFNMGIGFVVVVRKRDAEGSIRLLKKHRCVARLIGRIEDGKGGLAWA